MQTHGKSLQLNKKKITGLTLVEVVISIIIFGFGIVIIMSMISNNVRWLYDIKNKDTALTIAKEGIDIVYHIRDSNIERGMFWNCADIDFGAPDNCGDYFYSGGSVDTFVVDWDPSTRYTMRPYTTTGDAQIYYHTGNLYTFSGGSLDGFFYNHQSSYEGTPGQTTFFRRTIEFRALSGYASWTGNVLEITSRVEFDRGSETRNVILQSIIGDTRI